jgi:DNA helicase HerA-like ATPase
MGRMFELVRAEGGSVSSAVVIDEAQNYCPESNTGLLTRVRVSFDRAFEIASEGRKFNLGLLISTQRPARVSKDILSQCNTHVIFGVANAEDLGGVKGSFEAASYPLLEELPGMETGLCVVGERPRVEVPLFETLAVCDLRAIGISHS